MRRLTEKTHPVRHNQPECVRDQLHFNTFGVYGLTVYIDNILLIEVDAEICAAQVLDDLRVSVGFPGGIGPNISCKRKKTDTRHRVDIQDAVIRSCVRAGVEAAAVIAPVARAQQCKIAGMAILPRLHAHRSVDALEHIHNRRNDIAAGPADQGQAAVLMYLRPDPCVNADRTDIGAVAPVAVDEVYGMLCAVEKSVEIPV